MEEWIRGTINIESHEHDDTYMMLGELISRVLKKNPNIKCDHYGTQGQLKRDCGQGTPTKNVFTKNNPFRMSLPSGLCRKFCERRH